MLENMNKISHDRAMMLAQQYQSDPEMKYIVYNIRRRSYILHNPYQYYYRFSRRESVWNTRILKLEDLIEATAPLDTIADIIFHAVNKNAEDTVNFKLKRTFGPIDCHTLLHYYFNGKCNLAYYDYYLGRVCLIKERDKSDDFSDLIGSRYYFIDDLHNVIQYQLGLSESFLKDLLEGVMKEEKMVQELDGYEELHSKLLIYLQKGIEELEAFLASTRKAPK